MNLILLFEDDFVSADLVRLSGRRRDHVLGVHRVSAGDQMVVGVLGGKIGKGVVTGLDPLEMNVTLDRDPPSPLDVSLVMALPRPKVLNRLVASVTSLGVKRIYLMNAWRVEKSYWKSPKLSDDNLRLQSILGLEQARDTILPRITLHRFFRELVDTEAFPGRRLVAHPYAAASYPAVTPATLAIGPEGGFIAKEIESLERAGFESVTLGPRILRVETAIAALLGRLL